MVRIKHRYLLVNIHYPNAVEGIHSGAEHATIRKLPWTVQFRRPSPDTTDPKLLSRLIRDGIGELFGDYGSGMVGTSLKIVYFSPATSTAIIRVSRAHYRMVWAALTYATFLPRPSDEPCVFQIVRVSGTIRKAEEEAIRRARLSIAKAESSAGHERSSFDAASGNAKDGKTGAH